MSRVYADRVVRDFEIQLGYPPETLEELRSFAGLTMPAPPANTRWILENGELLAVKQ